MRYIFLLVALISLPAYTKDIAFFKNQANGYVVLTDEVCTKDKEVFKELQRAYAFNDKGDSIEGCYYVTEKETVRLIWSNGKEKIYPVDAFKVFDQPKLKEVFI